MGEPFTVAWPRALTPIRGGEAALWDVLRPTRVVHYRTAEHFLT
jgi:hypothetical protein